VNHLHIIRRWLNKNAYRCVRVVAGSLDQNTASESHEYGQLEARTHESSSAWHDVPASSDIDLPAAWPGCQLHSRTRPLVKKILEEGGKRRKNKKGGENF